jgi:hypothetical protein
MRWRRTWAADKRGTARAITTMSWCSVPLGKAFTPLGGRRIVPNSHSPSCPETIRTARSRASTGYFFVRRLLHAELLSLQGLLMSSSGEKNSIDLGGRRGRISFKAWRLQSGSPGAITGLAWTVE